ncbi:MAG: hypothetical protein CMH52_09970 [Myxococcales bacterium]|nr:hypothetical protein [Myxococcales bacterium]
MPFWAEGHDVLIHVRIIRVLVLVCIAFMALVSGVFSLDQGTIPVQVHRAAAKVDGKSVSTYDITRLALLGRTVIHLKENYVDPSRIDEAQMLGSALEYLQSEIDDVFVSIKKNAEGRPDEALVKAGSESKSFQLSNVENLWQMSFKLKDIFKYIQRNAKLIDRPKYVEYAAINGLLSTLDPHSVLLGPNEYREMKLSTYGRFGGLGIVIQIEDGYPVIVRPIPNTPAYRAGLKAGDKVVQIGLDSTVNMTTDETVELLRGEPNTPAVIWISRSGWSLPRKFVVPRAEIEVDSVHRRLLKGRIGLIRIDQFQSSTHDELVRAQAYLESKAKKRLKGLIIDLRGNPGGLLDQAVRIADNFIVSGPLVTTVGYGQKVRQPKMATRAGTNTRLPIAVLIDESSASASEIVAGALKNHNRAILIGRRSFGKGSVQVIYDNQDDSALKLTIAQYLTPGDESIQSIGVTPDIQVRPLLVDKSRVDLFVEIEAGEKRLPKHLQTLASGQNINPSKSAYSVSYLRDLKTEKKIAQMPEKLLEDYETQLAAQLLRTVKSTDREVMLRDVRAVMRERRKTTDSSVNKALAERGIDWTAGSRTTGLPKAKIDIKTNLENQTIIAGTPLKVTVTITNHGSGDYLRLAAISRSKFRQLDNREFLFGRLQPGESKSWTTEFAVDAATPPGSVNFDVSVSAQNSEQPVVQTVNFKVVQPPLPAFAFDYRIDDRRFGNGDGLLQSGEVAELNVRVKNRGAGAADSMLGILKRHKDDPDRKLIIERGRIESGRLESGQVTHLKFKIRVKDVRPSKVPLRLVIVDPKTGEITSGTVQLIVVQKARRLRPEKLNLKAKLAAIDVYSHYWADSPRIGTLDGHLNVRAGMPGWYRVTLPDGAFGWVRRQDVEPGGHLPMSFTAMEPNGLIRIDIENEPRETTGAHPSVAVVGRLASRYPLKDLRVFRNNKKIFFQSADNADASNELSFDTLVPLVDGINQIEIVGRTQADQIRTRKFMILKGAQ